MTTLKVKLYSSVKDRGIGLIGQAKPEPVMFLTRFGIHTFGLKFPIDVVVLSNNNVVVKLKEGLKPNRFFIWPIKFDKVLELPAGTIEKNDIRIGSKINLKIEL